MRKTDKLETSGIILSIMPNSSTKSEHSATAVVYNCFNIMSLPIIRLLGVKELNITALFSNHRFYTEIIQQSKYIKEKIFFDNNSYESELINCLLKYGEKQKIKPVLFLASDQDMIITSKNRELLKELYSFTLPPHNLLESILNKESFIDLATKNKLPIPKSKYLDSSKGLLDIIKDFDYPFIIKPSWRNNVWLKYFREQKVIYINSKDDLDSKLHLLSKINVKFLVQEIIPGDENNIFCTFAVLDTNSNPLEIGSCKKIHQYPPYFGNTSLAKTIEDEELEETSKNIFQQLNLIGYSSIEYKKDPRDGKLKILEITPNRFNRQFAVTSLSGQNLPYTLYNFETGGDIKPTAKLITNKLWMSEVNELRAIKSYLSSKEFSLIKWIYNIFNIRIFEIFSIKDIKPFLTLIKKTLKYKNL